MLSLGLCTPRISLRPLRHRIHCSVEQDGALEFRIGSRVRVKQSIMVYHVPKRKEGLDIKGMEGSIASNVRRLGEVELSPNYPWKIQFEAEGSEGKKPKKFFVHLVLSPFHEHLLTKWMSLSGRRRDRTCGMTMHDDLLDHMIEVMNC